MTLQLILASLNVVLVWFSIYMYARTKGKQEQYEKARNSFLNSKIDTICDKLVELEKKYGKLLEERRCVQLDKDTMEVLRHIDMTVTAVSVMVTEDKINKCEEKEDFKTVEYLRKISDCDKTYMVRQMLRNMKVDIDFAEMVKSEEGKPESED